MNHRSDSQTLRAALALLIAACGPAGMPSDTETSTEGTTTATTATATESSTASTVSTASESSSTASSAEASEVSSETTWGTPECPDTFEGDLALTDSSDIDSLRTVFRVTGHVFVEDTSFTNLEFLSCLQRIDGSLLIRNNPVLEDLEGLEQLESLIDASPFGGVSVEFNPQLGSLAALGAVREMQRLQVWDNDSLTNIGFDGLETLGVLAVGECVRGDEKQPYGFSNDALTTIEGFASLRDVRVEIGGQSNLTSLGALHEVKARGGDFSATFWHNPQLAAGDIEAIDAVGCGNAGSAKEQCLCPNPG